MSVTATNDVRHWNVENVLYWLNNIQKGKFREYSLLFKEQQITGEVLLSLNNKNLKEDLNINIFGHRQTLLNEIEKLKSNTNIKYNNNNNLNSNKTFTSSSGVYFDNNINNDNWENLKFQKHFMNDDEYKNITESVIKQKTGTEISETMKIKQSYGRALKDLDDTIKKRTKKGHNNSDTIDDDYKIIEQKYDKNVPNWDNIDISKGIKYSWDSTQYKWIETRIYFKLALLPFEQGSLRDAYYCLDVTNEYNKQRIINKTVPNTSLTKSATEKTRLINQRSKKRATSNDIINGSRTYTPNTLNNYDESLISKLLGYRDTRGTLCVAKKCKYQYDTIETYFNDVRTQCEAERFAVEYNKYNPPKKIKFLNAYVIQILNTNEFYCLEEYLHGAYAKYLGNNGYVDNIRNTPSAFAHFSFYASNQKIVICDLQGVGDLYTDPQIHTYNSKGFGLGNRGPLGFTAFINTHLCNSICKHLKLPKLIIEKNYLDGTNPHKLYMDIKKVSFIHPKYCDNEELLYILPERILTNTSIKVDDVYYYVYSKIKNNPNYLSNIINNFGNINNTQYMLQYSNHLNGYNYRKLNGPPEILPPLIPTEVYEQQNNKSNNNNNNNDSESTCCWCTVL